MPACYFLLRVRRNVLRAPWNFLSNSFPSPSIPQASYKSWIRSYVNSLNSSSPTEQLKIRKETRAGTTVRQSYHGWVFKSSKNLISARKLTHSQEISLNRYWLDYRKKFTGPLKKDKSRRNGIYLLVNLE